MEIVTVGFVTVHMILLVSIALTLVGAVAYCLYNLASPLVRAWYENYQQHKESRRQVNELRQVGRSMRAEMEQLSSEFLDDVSQLNRG